MKNLLLLSILAAGFDANAVTKAHMDVQCSAKINQHSLEMKLDPTTQTLTAQKDGVIANVIVLEIRHKKVASAVASVEGKKLMGQTGFIALASSDQDSPFLGLFDFGEAGKVSIFCNLKKSWHRP